MKAITKLIAAFILAAAAFCACTLVEPEKPVPADPATPPLEFVYLDHIEVFTDTQYPVMGEPFRVNVFAVYSNGVREMVNRQSRFEYTGPIEQTGSNEFVPENRDVCTVTGYYKYLGKTCDATVTFRTVGSSAERERRMKEDGKDGNP